MKLHERLAEYKDITVPWEVHRFTNCNRVSISGDQALIGKEGDYGSIEELRTAIAWYVDQLGGKVTWGRGEEQRKKEKKKKGEKNKGGTNAR